MPAPHIPKALLSNPLVNPRPLPHGAFPYDEIKAAHFVPAVDWAIAEAQSRINAIVNNPDPADFENTIHPLAFADEELARVNSPIGDISSIANTPDVQAQNAIILPRISAFMTEVLLNERLFSRIKAVYDRRETLTLTEAETALLNKTYADFASNGAALTGPARARFKLLSERLSLKQLTYRNNITNQTRGLHIVIPPDQTHRLAGIPEDTLKSFSQRAKTTPGTPEGSYVIPMSPPPVAVLTYAHDRTLRHDVVKMLQTIGAKGKFHNGQTFRSILKIKHEISQLLGFKHYADNVISTGHRMTDDYREVITFVERNARAYKDSALTFYDDLEKFAAKDGVKKLKPWDTAYYLERKKKTDLDLDSKAVKPYLELESCLKGLFKTGEKIFNIRIAETSGKYPVIDADTRSFEIFDATTGSIKALFFLNPFSNPDKRAGAWMSPARNAGLFRGEQVIPIVANNLNLQKTDGVTLLTQNERDTLYHEFGHACHGMMGQGIYPAQSGTSTSWDYVELPSQKMELWAYKKNVRDLYAHHHLTGAPMPEDMAQKMERSNLYDAALAGLRQSELALIDLSVYSTSPEKIGNLKAFENAVLSPYALRKPNKTASPRVLNFSHIISGYGAGYYVYKWAEALVADVHQSFLDREAAGEGAFPPDLCKAYADCMISPGGSRSGAQMLADFKRAAGCNDLRLDPLALFRAQSVPVPVDIEQEIIRHHNLTP